MDKRKKVDELVIAKVEKARRAADSVIAKVEKAKRAAELVIADRDKAKLPDELIIADVDKAKSAAVLVQVNMEKAKLAAELLLIKKELASQKEEKKKYADESIIANAKNAKLAAKEVRASAEKAKLAAKLVIANIERAKLTARLIIADKELALQNKEKQKRATELFLANVEKAKRSAELVIANVEKTKHATELVIAGKELVLAKEKAKQVTELLNINKELTIQITKRKQSERALKESNDKFLSFANHIQAYIAYVDAKTLRYKFVNDLYEKSFGIPREKIVGSHMRDVIGEKNFQVALKQINEVKSGKSVTYENTFDMVSGKRWLLLNYSPVFGTNNKVVGIALVSQDITERKRAEEVRAESELRFRTFVEHASLAIVVSNEGIISYANPKASKMFGLPSVEEIGGRQVIEFFAPQYREESKERTRLRSLGHPVPMEFESLALRPDGAQFPIHVSVSPIQLSDGKAHIAFISDITERKILEKELQASEIKFRELFEANTDGISILSVNPDPKAISFLDMNENSAKMLGYTKDEMMRMNPSDFLKLTKEKIEKRDEELKLKGYCDFETNFRHKNGNDIVVEIKAIAIDYSNQPAIMNIVRDITLRNLAEQELITAKEKAEESDRLKSAFLTNMSHEIRTPMNGILGFAKLLKEPNLTGEEQQDFIRTIEISGERMLTTINNIVDISKIESKMMELNIKESDINNQIEFLYMFFKPEVDNKKVKFSFKIGLASKEAIIKTDQEKVNAILTNLIKNAIKFTDEGSIEFGYEKKGECLEFFVRDTGIGIPETHKEIVFERFRQGSESPSRGYEGSGLGLSISKTYVEMLGGKIWVESKERKGSTFYFTIPYNAMSRVEKEVIRTVSEKDKEVEIKNLKILIVEDDEISYLLLTRTLDKISKEIISAKTGVEAIVACRNNPDIDLILMDIKMPDMDGYEATLQIRQFNTDVIIIAQTAYGFPSDREEAIKAGCNDFITKPINMTLLYELIKKYCNK